MTHDASNTVWQKILAALVLLIAFVAAPDVGRAEEIDFTPYLRRGNNALLDAVAKATESTDASSVRELFGSPALPEGFSGFSVDVKLESRPQISRCTYDTDTLRFEIEITDHIVAKAIASYRVPARTFQDPTRTTKKTTHFESRPATSRITCGYDTIKYAWHVDAEVSIGGHTLQISDEAIKALLSDDVEGAVLELFVENVVAKTYTDYHRLKGEFLNEYGMSPYQVPNYYFASFRFTEWASWKTIGRYVAGSIVTKGAYLEKIEGETEKQLELEAEEFGEWLLKHVKGRTYDAFSHELAPHIDNPDDLLKEFARSSKNARSALVQAAGLRLQFYWQPVKFYYRIHIVGNDIGPRLAENNHLGFVVAIRPVGDDAHDVVLNAEGDDRVDQNGGILPESGGKTRDPSDRPDAGRNLTVNIERVECVIQQEGQGGGADDCYLIFVADGRRVGRYPNRGNDDFNMRSGDVKQIGRSITFAQNVEIQLWDKEFGRDSFFGRLRIPVDQWNTVQNPYVISGVSKGRQFRYRVCWTVE